MSNVIVLIGAGQIGQAIARRVGVGKHVVLADRREASANAAAEVMGNAGYAYSSRMAGSKRCGPATWCGSNPRTALARCVTDNSDDAHRHR